MTLHDNATIRTLDHWEPRLNSIPLSIDFAEMRLFDGRDDEHPVFVGPGRIEIRSRTRISFAMFAVPTNPSDASHRLARASQNPYEALEQFRLRATDYQGVEWSGGWTVPTLKDLSSANWLLTGPLDSLLLDVSGPSVCSNQSVELVFKPKIRLPMREAMTTITSIGDTEIQRSYAAARETICVLGSNISFFYKPSSTSLWVTADVSDELTHPYLENWLSEPLRILLGQLIYPRIVARNFGDGRAMVSLRRSPVTSQRPNITALLRTSAASAGADFWSLYTRLLIFIATERDPRGEPNFESHRVTRFYEEIIQAHLGSRWVLCMTLASMAEGLTLSITRRKKIDHALGDLVKRGVLREPNRSTWRAVRNSVMHGNLVSPWGTKEDDERLRDLADLVHRLTMELVRKSAC